MAKRKHERKKQVVRQPVHSPSRSKLTPSAQTRKTTARAKGVPDEPAAIELPPALPDFPIIGIGASAGGLEAYTLLLQALPPDLGAALVIVQHLSPKHDSVLPDLLAGSSRLPVVQVTDGMPIQPGKVYVVPPNKQMENQRRETSADAPSHRSLAAQAG